MKQWTLNDFKNLPFRTYQKENPHRCVFCNEIANNGGFNMCNSHTDIYRKLRREAEEKRIEMGLQELNIDMDQIEITEFYEGIISEAYQNDTKLNDAQIDFINDSFREWVYDEWYKTTY